MGFSSTGVKDLRRAVTITVVDENGEEQSGKVWYYLGKLTAERDKLPFLEELFGGPDEKNGLIADWEMTYGDGTPFPPTKAGIEEAEKRGEMLPHPFLWLVMTKIIEDARPNSLSANNSPNT